MTNPLVPSDMQRVIVVGTSGSGKSTLAKALSGLLGYPHIELDALNWMAGWQPRPIDEFRARVEVATSAAQWVLDGNYSVQRGISWPRADTAVFLDYGLPLIFWRLTKRIVARAITREDLWNTGNRETVIKHLQFNQTSLYYWAYTTQRRRRQEIPRLVNDEYAHLRLVHLRSPRQTTQWLADVRRTYRVA